MQSRQHARNPVCKTERAEMSPWRNTAQVNKDQCHAFTKVGDWVQIHTENRDDVSMLTYAMYFSH